MQARWLNRRSAASVKSQDMTSSVRPTPEVEEIDPGRERRERPLKRTEVPDYWEGC